MQIYLSPFYFTFLGLFYFMSMDVLPTGLHLHTGTICEDRRGHQIPLKLELRVVVSHLVTAEI